MKLLKRFFRKKETNIQNLSVGEWNMLEATKLLSGGVCKYESGTNHE